MALHPDLNNLRLLCSQVETLDHAIFILSHKMGKETKIMRRTMMEVAIQELKQELDYVGRQIQRLLNNHYAKYNTILFNPPPSEDAKS